MTAWSRSLTVAYGVSICESLCIEKITSHICGVEGPTTGAYCKKGKIRRKLRKQTETSGGCGCCGCCCGGGSSRRSSGEVLVPFVSICCKGSTLGKSDSRKRTVYCGNASQNADKEEKYHGQWPHHHDRQLIEEAVNESGGFLVYKVQLLATSATRRTGCGDQKGETPLLFRLSVDLLELFALKIGKLNRTTSVLSGMKAISPYNEVFSMKFGSETPCQETIRTNVVKEPR